MSGPSRLPTKRQSSVGRAASVGLPPPLDLIQKQAAIRGWSHRSHKFAASDLSVLIALVHRQNANSGRCDVGVEKLIEDTGFKRRSVESALSKLQAAGAIVRNPFPGPNKRKWIILKPEDATGTPKFKAKEAQSARENTTQDSAQITARSCARPPQDLAVIKEKEKEKKKREEADQFTRRAAKLSKHEDLNKAMKREQEFERRFVKTFSTEQLGYEALMTATQEALDDARKLYFRGQITLEDAVEQIQRSH